MVIPLPSKFEPSYGLGGVHNTPLDKILDNLTFELTFDFWAKPLAFAKKCAKIDLIIVYISCSLNVFFQHTDTKLVAKIQLNII